MKDYPSIARAVGQSFRELPGAFIFDKLDGHSVRSGWNRKRGWYKHGLRHTRVDQDSTVSFFAEAPRLFMERLSEPLARIAHDARWRECTIYYEYWGARSLAGFHEADDPKFLSVFDVADDTGEILPPADFRKLFEEHVMTARFLGRANWTRGYVDQVRQGQIDGVTSEGVVAKLGTRGDVLRAKAKTQAWIDRVLARHGEAAGRKLIES